ncbi:CRISPR-associated protein Cas4 [Gemmiger sp.]
MNTDDYLQMSGIQHFAFCRRQWALAYLEQQWQENQRTAAGRVDHARCHDDSLTEKRGGLLIVRGMRVVSHRLKLTGSCDVVEFRAAPDGVPLQGRAGLWLPMPVEYKHGAPKESDADRLQLCAQAMALEEMLVCDVPEGALYYAETRRRETVPLTPELREKTQAMADEMNRYFARGYTPKSKPGKHCNACSLKELCLPVLYARADPTAYLRAHIDEEVTP